MRKSTAVLIVLLLIFAVTLTAFASGGSVSDPLVTLSYVRQIYSRTVEANAAARAQELFTQKSEKLQNGIDAYIYQRLSAGIAASIAQSSGQTGAWREVTLAQGDTVTGPVGAGMVLVSGTAATNGVAPLIDVTHGRELSVGVAAAPNTYYMVSQAQDAGLRITSASAVVRVKDGAAAVQAGAVLYEDEAQRLNAMGLFRGSNHGFELNRRPTRQEALIMLIRLLGEEDAALAYTGKASFTDLTGWPDGIKYVAYGESRGYTNGISETEFAQQSPAEGNVYFTYVLRALGYDDKAGDFEYRQSMTKAMEVGLITQAQYSQMQQTGMLRDHMALISYNALWVQCKGSSQTLGQRLVERGVITQAQLDAAKK